MVIGDISCPNYFLIPTSNENDLIYLFITQTPEGEILYSSVIVYLHIDWFTGYNGIMI